jgi:hypothetical protein
MFGMLLNFLFGCRHRHLTRPITPVNADRVPEGQPYVVCLGCTRKLAFDPAEMKVGKVIRE